MDRGSPAAAPPARSEVDKLLDTVENSVTKAHSAAIQLTAYDLTNGQRQRLELIRNISSQLLQLTCADPADDGWRVNNVDPRPSASEQVHQFSGVSEADYEDAPLCCMVCKREAGAAMRQDECKRWSGLASAAPSMSLELVMLTSCDHFVCKPCLLSHVEGCLRDKKLPLGCPVTKDSDGRSGGAGAAGAAGGRAARCCGHPIQEFELSSLFLDLPGAEDMQATIQRAEIEAAIQAAGGQLVKCPSCHAECEKMTVGSEGLPRAGASSEKDLSGRPMSAVAVKHRDKHRLRCRSCDADWCTVCNVEPYHLGMTCEEYAAKKDAVKCRYCDDALAGLKELTVAREEKRLHEEADVAQSGLMALVMGQQQGAEHPARRKALLLRVCGKAECRERADGACSTRHSGCGHACGGIKAEPKHLPCLQEECGKVPGVTGEDYCGVCYIEGLSAAPSIQLACGHIVHESCIRKTIAAGHPGARITFGHIVCPMCRTPAAHPALEEVLRPWKTLEADVRRLASARLAFEGIPPNEPLLAAGGKYHGKHDEYAMDRYAFYPCSKCNKPYFGGARQCGEGAGDAAAGNRADLQCPKCSPPPPGIKPCGTHGTEHLEYKCRFCCNPAVWFCFSTTHFCEPCHKLWGTRSGNMPIAPCPSIDGTGGVCPLGQPHPPSSKDDKGEFSLGCSACRMANAGQR